MRGDIWKFPRQENRAVSSSLCARRRRHDGRARHARAHRACDGRPCGGGRARDGRPRARSGRPRARAHRAYESLPQADRPLSSGRQPGGRSSGSSFCVADIRALLLRIYCAYTASVCGWDTGTYSTYTGDKDHRTRCSPPPWSWSRARPQEKASQTDPNNQSIPFLSRTRHEVHHHPDQTGARPVRRPLHGHPPTTPSAPYSRDERSPSPFTTEHRSRAGSAPRAYGAGLRVDIVGHVGR